MSALETTGGSVDWTRFSALLEVALTGDPMAVDKIPKDFLELAQSCKVLRFEESTAAVNNFVRQHLKEVFKCLEAPFGLDQVEQVEIWNIKEGHTASVWKVTVLPIPPGNPIHFVLNVARDVAAGQELLLSASVLQCLKPRILSVNIARVLMKTHVPAFDGIPNISVIAQEWIDDAYELGFLEERATGERRLFAIERFLTTPDEPGRIVSVAGHRLDPPEHNRIIFEVLMATLEGATFDHDCDGVTIPSFELNEGDWVLSRGHAHLVPASAGHAELRLGEALGYFLLHLPAKYGVRDPAGRETLICIARRAIQAFCTRGDAVNLADWVDRASRVPVNRWREFEWAGDMADVVDSSFERLVHKD